MMTGVYYIIGRTAIVITEAQVRLLA